MSLPLPIETERLTLARRYTETDYDDLLKLQSNDDVTRFLLYEVRRHPSRSEGIHSRYRLADVPGMDERTDRTVTLADRYCGRRGNTSAR